MQDLIVIGGGPAGLMAADTALAMGRCVTLFDASASLGRKILIAGKGGLNLTHSEDFDSFVGRYRERAPALREWLRDFDAPALREFVHGLGIATMVGSSGRVFPHDLKAAPLLRSWLRRLRAQGLEIHTKHRWRRFSPLPQGGYRFDFETEQGPLSVDARSAILALGGASWARLGSDGLWQADFATLGIDCVPLKPANGGFECHWSAHLRQTQAGQPLKSVRMYCRDLDGALLSRKGELMLTEYGIEGSLVYALHAPLREQFLAQGQAQLWLDLAPDRDAAAIAQHLRRAGTARSLSQRLGRAAGLREAKLALVYELTTPEERGDPAVLAERIKFLPLTVHGLRPIEDAISSAGGVRLEALDASLMLHDYPGIYCAGEMLDWEAPTGGYLLQACFASGLRAARAAVTALRSSRA